VDNVANRPKLVGRDWQHREPNEKRSCRPQRARRAPAQRGGSNPKREQREEGLGTTNGKAEQQDENSEVDAVTDEQQGR